MDNARITRALLIRHAHTDAIGRYLAGRLPGVSLSAEGRTQADQLGRALSTCTLAAIYSSPLQRTMETAQALARYQQVSIREHDALNEIDFGEWTGLPFPELEALPGWHAFNRARSTALIPAGEAAHDVQQRMVAALESLARRHAGERFALVTHGDPIRYVVLHYAGASLDHYLRFEISPASVTAIDFSGHLAHLAYVNATSAWC